MSTMVNDHNDNGDRNIFDRLADCWARYGQWTAHRPAQLLGYAIAGLLVAIGLTYSITTSSQAKHSVNRIQSQFCVSTVESASNAKLCQELFRKLLENPTKTDIRKLKDLTR
jgi:hypothetical protein